MEHLLESRQAVNMYVETNGQVVITQEDSMGGQDSAIYLEPHDIPLVMKSLERLASEATAIREQAVSQAAVPATSGK